MAEPRPEARIPCPQCGGAIHPIAGRCKHCKADLAALRGARPAAAATLPALVQPPVAAPQPPAVSPAAIASAGVASFGDEPVAEPILPPRVTGRMQVAAPVQRWPWFVIAVSAAATVMAIGAIVRSTDEPVRLGADAGNKPVAFEIVQALPPPPPPPPPPRAIRRLDEVTAPIADDLAEYTRGLPNYGNPRATIETPLGTIHCLLLADKAPATVANFIGLATGKKPWRNQRNGSVERGKPFYDGLIFHRAIKEFMIQGGDPFGTGTGGPGYKFGDEIVPDLKMEPGTLAMANSGPDTNGSQFFITETAPSWLDGKHTIFGRCEDVDVVRKIARVDQDSMNKPETPVTMTVTISR